MVRTPLAKQIRRLPFFYGWVVLPMAMVSIFFTGPGQTYSFSIFIDSFIKDLGWSRTLVSSLYSTATLASGMLMFIVGRLIDRVGARWMCIAAAALLGIACMINSVVVVPSVLFIGFFLARFSGQGTLELSTGTVAPHWFRKRRAFAMMVVGMGSSLSAIVFPLLNTHLAQTLGWRVAFRYLAYGLWFIFIPLAFLFLIGKPEDVGLKPDGRDSTADETDETVSEDEHSVTQIQALRLLPFWLVAFASFQFAMIATGIGFHYISILRERGFTKVFAARAMALSPFAGIISAIVLGFFLDRIKKPQFILAATCLLQAVAYAMLAVVSTPAQAYLRSIIAGSSSSALWLSVGFLKPYLFGRRYIGGVSGLMAVITVIGSALGPVVFGVVYDTVGGYTGILVISAILPLLAALGSVFIRKPQGIPPLHPAVRR